MVWGSSRRRGEARRSQHGAELRCGMAEMGGCCTSTHTSYVHSQSCWYRRYGRVLQDELAGGGNKIFELCQGFDKDDLSTFDANNMVSNDMSESIILGQFQSLWIEMLYVSNEIPLDSDEVYRGLGV
ncbi:uncharacterized protein L203_100052 [Cryptococcus depauperatus CBS 7841]|uniref:Uncharacterized protein n=1 Tax=Cryptococcus depauperatus CBS 7841 TaxID=1295531 RepID=A0AAJ8LY63_9TREE